MFELKLLKFRSNASRLLKWSVLTAMAFTLIGCQSSTVQSKSETVTTIKPVVQTNSVVIAPEKVIKRECPQFEKARSNSGQDVISAGMKAIEVGTCHRSLREVSEEYLNMLDDLNQTSPTGFKYWKKREQPDAVTPAP